MDGVRLAGAKELADALHGDDVARVILLSDGNAFASSRMRSRLTEKNELSDANFSVSEELAKRSFLRRKSQQGRRQVDPEGGPD